MQQRTYGTRKRRAPAFLLFIFPSLEYSVRLVQKKSLLSSSDEQTAKCANECDAVFVHTILFPSDGGRVAHALSHLAAKQINSHPRHRFVWH